MNGKILDASLILLVVVLFLGVAMISPGVGNLLVAYFGMVGFGYYNSLIRHDPKNNDVLRPRWR